METTITGYILGHIGAYWGYIGLCVSQLDLSTCAGLGFRVWGLGVFFSIIPI